MKKIFTLLFVGILSSTTAIGQDVTIDFDNIEPEYPLVVDAEDQYIKFKDPKRSYNLFIQLGDIWESHSVGYNKDIGFKISALAEIEIIRRMAISIGNGNKEAFDLIIKMSKKEIEKIKDTTSDCMTKKDGDEYYFIPSLVTESDILATNFLDCSSHNYLVVMNLWEANIEYYKRTSKDDPKCKKYNKIKPRVGSKIHFKIKGDHTIYDSFDFSASFESKNLELQAKIVPFLDIASKEGDKSVGAVFGEDDDTAVNILAFFNTMKKEFKSYYNKSKVYEYSNEKIARDILYIKKKLDKYCFIVQEYSAKGLLAGITNYLDEQNLKTEEKQKILKTVDSAVYYYDKILKNSDYKRIFEIKIKNMDQLNFNFNFDKEGKEVFIIPDPPYSIMISGGVKIDFSTGVFYNTLIDHEYTIQNGIADTENSGKSKIIKKDTGPYTIGIGILAHVYTRSGGYLNYAINSGFIVEADTALKYLAGGSLIIGYKQRFIINTGAVFGTVNRLDNSYNEAFNTYVPSDQLASISSSIPTVSKWDVGFYIGLTYNLGGTTLTKKSDKKKDP